MESNELNVDKFHSFFDSDKRLINEHEFRRAIFHGGINESLRKDAWKFLFQYFSYNSTPRERSITAVERFVEYYLMRERWQVVQSNVNAHSTIPMLAFSVNIDPDGFDCSACDANSMKIQSILKVNRYEINSAKLNEDIIQVDKDNHRTAYLIELNSALEHTKKLAKMLRNILITFTAYHQRTADSTEFNLGYTQGMNEIASVFLCVFQEESAAFWCFCNFMLLDVYASSAMTLNTIEIAKSHALKTNVAYYFTQKGLGLKAKQLEKILQATDAQLYDKLKEFQMENLYICHEWLLIAFKRLFATTGGLYLKCFEKLASHFVELQTASLSTSFKEQQMNIQSLCMFDLFICLALLKQMRPSIMQCNNEMDVYEVILTKFKNLFSKNFETTFEMAEEIYQAYAFTKCEYSSGENKSSGKKKFAIYEFMFGNWS